MGNVGAIFIGIIATLICLFGGVLIVLGSLFVFGTLLTYWNGCKTLCWALCPGKIVATPDDGDKTEEMPQTDGGATSKTPEFAYEYEVDGQQLTATTIQFRGIARSDTTNRVEQELYSTFHRGQSVDVYYNPTKPEEAVLQPGSPAGMLASFGIGTALVLAGSTIILGVLVMVGAGGALKFLGHPSVVVATFLIPGLTLTIFALRMLWTVGASGYWPTTEAIMIRSSVRAIRNRRERGYMPSVAYQYEVDGTTYTSTALNWGRLNYHNRDAAQRVVDKYAEGLRVMIYYDPQSPHRAVIEPTGYLIHLILLLIGSGLTAGGMALLFGVVPVLVVR